jgi:hypothetical protein
MRINTSSVTDPVVTFKFKMTEKDALILKDMLKGRATSRYEQRVANIVVQQLEKKL